MPLAGRNANIKITSITGTASTDQAATRSTGAGTANGKVQINSTTRRYWNPDSTPTLYLNSTLVPASNYNINYLTGTFEWLSGDPAAGTYTIDTEWLTVSSVAGGREWQLNVEQDAFDVTEFGSSGWREFMPNMAGATVALTRFWNDETFVDYLVAGNPRFAVELQVSQANPTWRYFGFARVANDQVTAGVDAIIGEQVNFQIDGVLYFST